MFEFKLRKKIKERMKDDELIKYIDDKDLFKRYLTLFVGCLLVAAAFNIFFLPYDLVFGGVSGISIITNKLFGLDPSLFIMISSIFLLFISFPTLGWEKTKGSIAGSIIFPLCVKLTANIGEIIQFNSENMLLVAVFGAVVYGVGSGINFKSGFTTGGTDILNQIISKYFKVSIGKSMLMSDGLIVLASGFYLTESGFAWENVMLAIIALYIISLISDKVILGISESKAFYIITQHETEVKSFVLRHLSHGATVLDARGGYTGNNEKVIMCIIPTKEYFLAKEGILKIDPNAFFLVTDAYEISGGK